MANDVVTPANPLVAPVEKKEFEEMSFDVNVSQRSCDKEPFEKVMCTEINCSAWDRRLSLNPHALVIYLEFVPAHGVAPKRFEEC